MGGFEKGNEFDEDPDPGVIGSYQCRVGWAPKGWVDLDCES